jgi:hypothetical protein
LGISSAHGLYQGSTFRMLSVLQHELNGINVLALLMCRIKIKASAEWFTMVKVYNVSSIARLRGHFPAKLGLFYLAGSRYQKSPSLSSVHLSPHLVTTNSIYYKGLTCQYLWYILLVNSNGRYRWEILTRNNRANFKLQPIGVVADMNGFPAIKVNALEFARNAKVQTGTNLSKLKLKCSDTSRCILWFSLGTKWRLILFN